VYNTIQVNKNQRIETTIEHILKPAKLYVGIKEPKSGLLAGYDLEWAVAFRNFVNESNPSVSLMELLISKDVFAKYLKGDFSALELVQKSLLRVDKEKYSLTVWDPVQ
jgi:hypothetical protein